MDSENEDFSEVMIPEGISYVSDDENSDSPEDEISDSDKENSPIIKRNGTSKICEFCKHNFPKFRDREFKKHKPRCEKWHTFVEADNKTCKLCEKTYSNNGLCLVHFESQKCPRKKIQMICTFCNQDFKNDRNFHTERFEKHKEMCKEGHKHVIDKNTCDFCRNNFATYNKALWHVANQKCHNTSLDERKVCQTCKNYYSESSFDSHEIKCKKWNKYIKNSKTNEKKLCRFCKTKFTKYSMALRHLGSRPTRCKMLPKNLKIGGDNSMNFKPCAYCYKEITNAGGRGRRHEIHQKYCPKNPNRKPGKCPLPFRSCTKCNKVLLKKGLANHENHCGNQKPMIPEEGHQAKRAISDVKSCRLLLHDISESKCGKKPCFQNQTKYVEQARLLMDLIEIEKENIKRICKIKGKQNLQEQYHQQMINNTMEEKQEEDLRNEKRSNCTKRPRSNLSFQSSFPVSKRQKLKNPEPEISEIKDYEMEPQDHMFEHDNSMKNEEKIKIKMEGENDVVHNGHHGQSDFQIKSNGILMTNDAKNNSLAKVNDENEIQEIQSVRPKTKVKIIFKGTNVITRGEVIKIPKTSVTLDDVKQYLKKQPEKFGMYNMAKYEFSKIIRENEYDLREPIAEDETADPLPFYDGQMILLECWLKKTDH